MTNDFVFEKYEHEGREYAGQLVAPLGKTIVRPIVDLAKKVISGGNTRVIRLLKDHYDAFTNPELDEKIREFGIEEVFITGLVEEICVYHNALGFLQRGIRTKIIRGCTVPFDEEKGKEAMKKLGKCGADLVEADEVPADVELIMLIEDEHDENSEELKSGEWPPHNMKGTAGSLTVRQIREALP